ncbi:hypothetical protein ACP70R_018652 [Stipagrostis hirtigluma subsp. patula]
MGVELEKSISALCGSLSAVVDHAESSSRALADAVSRRPIHLESSTSTFLKNLDRQAEAAGADLARLESMALGAVSFEELLGHCRVTLDVYARHADAIQARLASYGYVPPELEPEVDDAEEEDGDAGKLEWPGNGCHGRSRLALTYGRGRFDDDDDDALFEESMSLKNIGFSDAGLAAISSAAKEFPGSPKKLHDEPESADDDQKVVKEAELTPPQKETNGQGNAFPAMIRVSKEEYEQLPPYMKTLATWQELLEAISKLNSYFDGDEALGRAALNQDGVGAIGLGMAQRKILSADPAAAESINYGNS